jgi:tRNA (cmo5U34)-methyltransferase
MKNQGPAVFFDQANAATYDTRFAKVAAMKDALHLLVRLVFSELPADARILCVGAGTGAELLYLAQAYPQWRFTAVEPSAPMLDICRRHAEASGIASRCTFHEGYLDSLPEADAYDAATSILVSQFIMQPQERRQFFQEISRRLRPGGLLVSADLCADRSSPTYDNLFEAWLKVWKYAGMPAENIANLSSAFGRDVAVLPPAEVGAMIESGGFETPVLFFQTVLIHAWFAVRPG